MLEGKDDGLFEELVAHKELLGSTRNVSIAVLDSHTGESSLLDLHSDVLGEVEHGLNLLGRMNSRVGGGSEDVEALVTDLVNHIYFQNIK